MAPQTATGSFEKGGALFFSLIYFFLNALAEVSSTINARSILVKQHKLGFIHPVAFVIAQTVADIPVAVFQSLVFSCCYYFMLGLHKSASDFWTFELVLFTHYSAVSSLFRMLGAWAPNLNIAFFMAGTAMPICLTYAGYGPPTPTMHKWGSWIRRISPSPWALEALMGNEFSDITLHCTANQMVPHGSRYNDIRYQGCSLPGSVKGSSSVPGSTYLGIIYEFYRSHLWRNWGIIVVMWFIYVLLTAVGLTFMTGEEKQEGRFSSEEQLSRPYHQRLRSQKMTWSITQNCRGICSLYHQARRPHRRMESRFSSRRPRRVLGKMTNDAPFPSRTYLIMSTRTGVRNNCSTTSVDMSSQVSSLLSWEHQVLAKRLCWTPFPKESPPAVWRGTCGWVASPLGMHSLGLVASACSKMSMSLCQP